MPELMMSSSVCAESCGSVFQVEKRVFLRKLSSVYRQHERISLCLRLCSKLQIQSKMDSAYLLESLAGNFMDVVQYNEDNRGFEVCELETMDRVHVVRHATLWPQAQKWNG